MYKHFEAFGDEFFIKNFLLKQLRSHISLKLTKCEMHRCYCEKTARGSAERPKHTPTQNSQQTRRPRLENRCIAAAASLRE